ncbi:adenylate kinase [Actinomyces mediterranea]|uniref:adenylate kinase n=1 Tax=Actinomyces mediterranea TaxID=1871028 RepID=UPI000971395E|nr:adenylate kinase [Actinomyces mediterranea]
MTAVILLGPPGAGKGTQAARIAERLSIPAISTGEIFRANIAEGTQIGLKAKEYIDRGELVPDSVTNVMMRARLEAPDVEAGFLLDGYPRNVDQVHFLAGLCEDFGTKIDVVVEIQVDEDEVVTRMLKRAEEQHRADDTEPVMRHRFEVYRAQTEPVAAYYADHDMLEVVNGMGTVDEVSERIFAVLDAHREG